ncbi:MAG: hypothetical protein ACRC33_31945 [Gemmataceae bacterium]
MRGDDPRAGSHTPVWAAYFLFALVCLGMAASEFLYLSAVEAGSERLLTDAEQRERKLGRSLVYTAGEHLDPRVGKWGATGAFAVPGLAFAACGWWWLKPSPGREPA